MPYYRQSFKNRHLVPDDIKNIDGLAKLPVLTKEDIRRNLWNLVSRGFPRKKLIPCQSGGTGDPSDSSLHVRLLAGRLQPNTEPTVGLDFRVEIVASFFGLHP